MDIYLNTFNLKEHISILQDEIYFIDNILDLLQKITTIKTANACYKLEALLQVAREKRNLLQDISDRAERIDKLTIEELEMIQKLFKTL